MSRKKKARHVSSRFENDDDPLLQNQGRREYNGGPEKCAVCGGVVYTNGNCFKCGIFLPGGRHMPRGGRKDAYEYLQMSEDTRIANFRREMLGE